MKKEMQNYTQNRELSWLKFNQRVLEEAKDSSVPLLERMKFVSIFTSNLDEFFMIRVGSLYDMSLTDNSTIDSRSGMNPKEQLIEKLESFKGFPQEAELPSAPKQFIRYMTEDNRPQVKLDVDYENGMGISIGRLREDSIYDYKFIGLSHNTVRGAAGGAVLCAETLTAKGFITKK